MKTLRIKIGSLLILPLILALSAHAIDNESERREEYKLKAAFLYNFMKFTDWPKEKTADSNSITVGILGNNPFGKSFDPLKDKRLKEKKVTIQYFKSFEEINQTAEKIETLSKCHVLFVCLSETKHLNEIIKSVKGHSVLTVGDMKDFLESGGMINFLMENEKVRFEIHNAAARKEKLEIRSKLLRLAKRTIDR